MRQRSWVHASGSDCKRASDYDAWIGEQEQVQRKAKEEEQRYRHEYEHG